MIPASVLVVVPVAASVPQVLPSPLCPPVGTADGLAPGASPPVIDLKERADKFVLL